MTGQVWEVVGGKKDGLLVRAGKGLKTPEADCRLSFGSLVEELALDGERLHYRKLSGSGPETGWVSLTLKGVALLVRTDEQPNGGAAAFAPPARTAEAMPVMPRGGFHVVRAARAGAGNGGALHICCCSVSEVGHMTPALRIARGLAARSAVRKVTFVTNVYGAAKMLAWLETDPDTSGKLELVAFEDGWDQAAQDRSNDYAQQEDGTYFNQCNSGMGEWSVACMRKIAFGDDRPCCFLMDYSSFGFMDALGKLKAPQTVIRSTPLSLLAFLMVNVGLSSHAEEDLKTLATADLEQRAAEFRNATFDDSVQDTNLVHCFEFPPMLAAALPKVPKSVIPVGILLDDLKPSKWPSGVREFIEKPGPPVLYVSMGSVARFSQEQLAKVVDALKCPGEWRVLWSLRQAQQELLPPGGAAALGSDFFVSAWLPQAELLQHPSVAAFMSHCGWGACCEAIASAKPVVAFPMFADQYVNAWLLDLLGMSKTVDEEPLGMDPDAWKRRMPRVAGVRTGDVDHTRNRFTSEGLKNDIRMVLKGKSYKARATWIKDYSKQAGGVHKAAEVVERLAHEATAKLLKLETEREWPRTPVDRFRAVAEDRKDDIIAAAKGDVVMQVVVSGLATAGKFHVDCLDGRVEVHEGEASSPGITITVASEEALFATWNKKKDLTSFQVEGNELFARRLFSLLFVKDQDPQEVDRRTPRDGVLRPPVGAPIIAPCRAGKLETAPAWLKPDGMPEAKKRLLFISLPWAGHIVHLKRIAAWFAERPKYEAHFAYFHHKAPDLPSSVKLHGAEEGELTKVFDIMQDNLKALGMSKWDKGGIFPEEIDMETESYKYFRFMLRIVLKVKPAVVIADSGFSIGGMVQAACQVLRAGLIFIHSPGIKEKWIADAQADEEPAEKQKQMEKFASEMPQIDIGQVLAGKFDVTTLPKPMQYLLSGEGIELMRVLQIFGAMAALDPTKAPISLYPSSSWMVEDQAVEREFFTGTLLPLPERVQGEVFLSMSELQKSLDADLYKWIFSEKTQDPPCGSPCSASSCTRRAGVVVLQCACGRIVYVAFGTIVQGAKPIVDKLAAALDGGKWRVLWSLPQDMHEWLPAGLSEERWCVKPFVPQKDVFRCDRVRCFISHCGANSTIEALSCGVPMVCHPFFLDQYEWARTVRRHLRAGVQVDKFDSGPDAIRLAVTEVLEDPSYREAAQAVSKRLHEQAEKVKSVLGPEMTPKENLGPGVSVIAAIIISLMKGKDPWEITKLVHETNA